MSVHDRRIDQLFNSGLILALIPLLPAFAYPPAAFSEADTLLEAITVDSSANDPVGVASSASQAIVTKSEIEGRPLLRTGELVEVVPGMITTQHSGGGKANQFFLRGFNLDHGTDFSAEFDGVPLNLRTHGHGQGYLDMNSIIPELIDTVEYGKGPYYADVSDFSSAGYARFHTQHSLPKGLLSYTIGERGFHRIVGADSFRLGTGNLLMGTEINFYDGPWSNSQNLAKYNGLLRYTVDHQDYGYSVIGTAYAGRWDATDQIPLRAVDQGLISYIDSIDPSDGGKTQRYSLSLNGWRQTEWDKTEATAYLAYSNLDLYSNFTYFLDDPVNGDQIKQKDRRLLVGGKASETWYGSWQGLEFETRLGVELRHDHIPEVGLFLSRRQQVLSTVRNDKVDETSLGLYLESQIRWNDWFRTIAGVRGDHFRFDVNALSDSRNAGKVSDSLVSPKLSLIFGPWSETEFYLNFGYGFHSNDARGVTTRFDPGSGKDVSPVSPLARSVGVEAGVRSRFFSNLTSSLALWGLNLDSELVFVGDAGTNEPTPASRRYGVEWTNDYQPFGWLTLDGDLAFSQSRYRKGLEGLPDNARDVPNSVGRVISAGATVNLDNGFFTSLRFRHFGDIPLNETGFKWRDTSLVNWALGFQRKEHYRLEVQVLNLFDSNDPDISYYYASRLQGEAAGGIEDVHFHPVESRLVRLIGTIRF
jgi:outer membrane receptor protein involved in Fe transport